MIDVSVHAFLCLRRIGFRSSWESASIIWSSDHQRLLTAELLFAMVHLLPSILRISTSFHLSPWLLFCMFHSSFLPFCDGRSHLRCISSGFLVSFEQLQICSHQHTFQHFLTRPLFGPAAFNPESFPSSATRSVFFLYSSLCLEQCYPFDARVTHIEWFRTHMFFPMS